MHNYDIENIKKFAEATDHLYRIFFSKFPFLKPVIIKALLYSSGNFGLILMEGETEAAKYSIYATTEGRTVQEGMDSSVNVYFRLQKSIIDQIIQKKEEYAVKPYKLLKYLTTYLRAVAVKNTQLYEEALYGDKVCLRPGNDKDLFYLLKWYNDPELNRLAGWSGSKVTAAKLKYNMSKSFGYDPMNLMIDNEEGKPIGTIQLYDFNEQDKSCCLGIRIGDRDYWGKGYGEDAVNAILEYAFMKLDMHRMKLKVYEYNERAARCYVKCGFAHEGRTRQSAYIDGKFYDEFIMGILKHEYIEKRKPKTEDND